jgi:CRISPR-associated Csx2 family protein
MGRKVFLSFLGATSYKECVYTVGNAHFQTRFVQCATIALHCKTWEKETAKYIFFVTKTAKEANEADLVQELEKIGIAYTIKAIPEGIYENASPENIEKEIWETFVKIYEELEEGDEVIFDITHSFRYLPMLAMVLLNYAKNLIKIKVVGIYYGAFEVLGRAFEIDTKYPNIADRKVPIIDLQPFVLLQEWTAAANVFVEYGDSKALFKITGREIKPLLQTTSEEKEVAKGINKFIKSLQKVTESFKTNRGRDLVEGTIFKDLNESLSELTDDNFIVPLKPLLEKVSEKVANFSLSEDYKNGFKAVEWCIEHGLIQQGITMLQESIFTYYCFQAKLNYKNKKDRELISDCFYILNKGIENDEDKWKDTTKARKAKVKIILQLISKKIASEYNSLTDKARNDINHGGFSDSPKKPEQLSEILQKSYRKFCELLFSTENSEES